MSSLNTLDKSIFFTILFGVVLLTILLLRGNTFKNVCGEFFRSIPIKYELVKQKVIEILGPHYEKTLIIHMSILVGLSLWSTYTALTNPSLASMILYLLGLIPDTIIALVLYHNLKSKEDGTRIKLYISLTFYALYYIVLMYGLGINSLDYLTEPMVVVVICKLLFFVLRGLIYPFTKKYDLQIIIASVIVCAIISKYSYVFINFL